MRTPSNLVIDAGLGLATLAGRMWMLLPPNHGVSLIRNVSYGPQPRHRLDMYVPAHPRGVHLLFLHGGSFRTCSKESHTYVGRTLSAVGIHVYAIDYGLAPEHPYPVAHEDAIAALSWVSEGPARGAPVSVGGDSAGANIALALTVAGLGGFAQRPVNVAVPAAVLSLSGLLRVRGSAYAHRDHRIASARLAQIESDFLGEQAETPLAEPLLAIESATERGAAWVDDMPPVFVAVGDRDPIAGDSLALARALGPRPHTLRRYPNEGHAFMISPLRSTAAQCWADVSAFFDRFFGTGETP